LAYANWTTHPNNPSRVDAAGLEDAAQDTAKAA
jgi:hypothetical protein